MDDPQSSVAQMVGRMLKQSHSRIELGTFDADTEPAAIQRHIATATEINDFALQGHGYLVQSLYNWYSGQPQAAINSLHTAEQCYREAKSYSNVIVALANCADIYRVMGDSHAAFALLAEGEHINQTHAVSNHTGAMSLLFATRGQVWLDEQAYDAAADDFDQVFKVHERQSQDHAFATTHAWRGVAEIYLYRAQYAMAWSISRLAREAADRSANEAQRFAAYSLGARLALHDPDQPYLADEFFEAAQQALNAIKPLPLQAILLIQEARHFSRLGGVATAYGLLEQAEALLTTSTTPDLLQLVGWMREQLDNEPLEDESSEDD